MSSGVAACMLLPSNFSHLGAVIVLRLTRQSRHRSDLRDLHISLVRQVSWKRKDARKGVGDERGSAQTTTCVLGRSTVRNLPVLAGKRNGPVIPRYELTLTLSGLERKVLSSLDYSCHVRRSVWHRDRSNVSSAPELLDRRLRSVCGLGIGIFGLHSQHHRFYTPPTRYTPVIRRSGYRMGLHFVGVPLYSFDTNSVRLYSVWADLERSK